MYRYVHNRPVNNMDSYGLEMSMQDTLRLVQLVAQLYSKYLAAKSCFDALKRAWDMLGNISNDKRAHCTASCDIGNHCGDTVAEYLGYAKEVRDLIAGDIESVLSWLPANLKEWVHDNLQGGTEEESYQDLLANFIGLGCMNSPKGCIKCCECKYGTE